jgi:hypothetical protein
MLLLLVILELVLLPIQLHSLHFLVVLPALFVNVCLMVLAMEFALPFAVRLM